MMKLKNLSYRSLWYKKIFYYLQAGQSIGEAVQVAGDDMETQMLYEDIQTGQRMSFICRNNFSDIFSTVEIALLDVGEKTGGSKDICLSLSGLLKAQYIQKQKFIATAIYPIIVLFLAIGLLIMILMFIVPKIGPLFSDMPSLPFSTKILIATSEHVVEYWWIDLIVLFVFGILHLLGRKNISYTKYISNIKKIFLVRTLYVKDIYMLWHIEKWMQVICIGLKSHMALYESIQLATGSVSDRYMQSEFKKIEIAVGQGQTCADSIKLLFPRIHKQLRGWQSVIRSGEQTGSLMDVFLVCHEHIQSELHDSFEKAQKFVEPALIVGVGMMVLGICLSIILPMYQLTQSLNN